jgi:hypothetical protein
MNTVETIAGFFAEIGLPFQFAELPGPTFLPGVAIQRGVLTIDREKLLYPGDLLHEAGHLAVLPPAERTEADGDVGPDGGMEMAAIAWSYAAALHLGMPVEVVFHDEGYLGGAANLRQNFAQRRYIGVPLLAWMGLTIGDRFPAMDRWLRS